MLVSVASRRSRLANVPHELAARKARVERIEAEEEVIDYEQRAREFAEAAMLYWADDDERVTYYAAKLTSASAAR